MPNNTFLQEGRPASLGRSSAILDVDAYGRALLARDATGQTRALEAVHAHRCVEPTPRKL